MRYFLKHKNINVIEMEIDDSAKITKIYETINEDHIPLSIKYQKEIEENEKSINDWLKLRAIPFSRERVEEILHYFNLHNSQELLLKCWGLSLSDCYWLCPKNQNLNWEDINFYKNEFPDDMGKILFGEKFLEQLNIFSPDNTTAGWLKKRWIISGEKRILVKAGSGHEQQEPFNEVIASEIMKKLNINHIPYNLIFEKDAIIKKDSFYSTCENFTSPEAEFIPASEISKKNIKPDNHSYYVHIINCYKNLGIKNAQEEINKMIVIDYFIANIDRHEANFGILRNPDTLEVLSVAPIFDCGTSMWMHTSTNNFELKDVSETFCVLQDDQIKLVKNFDWFNIRTLDGITDIIDLILQKNTAIEDTRRDFFSKKLEINLFQLEKYINDLIGK